MVASLIDNNQQSMGYENILVSLCIPTNGVIDWVLPVLDSIYASDVDCSLFEVVITDNGNNQTFQEAIRLYQQSHPNLQYFRSEAKGFLCQIDCFKHAKGEFIKFINHRYKLCDGALEYLVTFAKENLDKKPVVFFANGSLFDETCDSFDHFVRKLSYYSSWSGGLALWKKDLDSLALISHFNELFPHTDILFFDKEAFEYCIINKKIIDEIDTGHAAKGKYNLFFAFAVEYPSIICDLLRKHDISIETFLEVKKDLLAFIADLYIDFIIRKIPASYNLEQYMEHISVYYSRWAVKRKVLSRLLHRIWMKFR